MTRFVIDASVVLAWCFDEVDPYAPLVLKALPGTRVVAPAHFVLEVANGLIIAQRRNRINGADGSRAVALVQNLPLELDKLTGEHATRETLALARAHGLTAYDAAYLELCIREGLPLASIDQALNGACEKVGIQRFLTDAAG